MAPTEQIIWEAKQRPSSLKGSRRSSTTIDASGCKVVRGFLLPSRSSSRSSGASTHEIEVPGLLASPIEAASPGFFRPTGSLYHAPEMAILRSDSESSLHKPSDRATFLRPPQLGGRSQTFHGRRASSWYDAGPGTTDLVAEAREASSSVHHVKLHTSMRRTQSDHTGLISMQAAAVLKIDTLIAVKASESCAISEEPEEENAIASDSDDDDEDDFLPVSGIAAQRSRPTYAQRRAMSDQRVECQQCLPPLPYRQLPPPALRVISTTIVQDFAIREIEEREEETPIEIKSFAYEEIIPPHELRPSSSRPRPIKGVLKKVGSRSSSEDSAKHVHTAIRRDSGAVVECKVVPDPASQVE